MSAGEYGICAANPCCWMMAWIVRSCDSRNCRCTSAVCSWSRTSAAKLAWLARIASARACGSDVTVEAGSTVALKGEGVGAATLGGRLGRSVT